MGNEYHLANITSEQLDRLKAYMHNAGGGYDFYTEGGVMIVRSSKVEDRTTEPKHRLAIPAAEIKRLIPTEGREPARPYHVSLVHLNDKTLRRDHVTTLVTLERVLGGVLSNHEGIISMLRR